MEGLLGDVRVDGGWLHSVLSYMTAPEAGVDRSYTDEKSSWIRHLSQSCDSLHKLRPAAGNE